MRGEDGVWRREERIVLGERRFAVENIDAGACDLSFPEEVSEGGIVDDSAAGGIDEDRSRLYERELFSREEAARLACERQVDGDDVAGGKQGVQVGVGDARCLLGAAVAIDIGAECGGDVCDTSSDGTGTDDAEFPMADLDAHEACTGLAISGSASAFGQLAVEGKNERERKLGHGLGRVAGTVRDGDALFFAVINGNMVDAGECDAEVFERCGFFQRFLPKRIIGNDGKVSIRKAIAQFILVFRQAVIGGDGEAVFLEIRRQCVKKGAADGERLCDDDVFHEKDSFH